MRKVVVSAMADGSCDNSHAKLNLGRHAKQKKKRFVPLRYVGLLQKPAKELYKCRKQEVARVLFKGAQRSIV